MSELFDDAARTLAAAPSRRRALRTLAGLVVAAAWPRAALAQACPSGQVPCGSLGICCGGTGFVCCGGTCCQTGQCTNPNNPTNATCCGGGHAPCNGGCCQPNEQCLNGTCVPRGSTGAGGSACPPGQTLCGS